MVIPIIYKLGAVVGVKWALYPKIIQPSYILSLSKVNSTILLRRLVDLGASVHPTRRQPIIKIIYRNLTHLLVFNGELALHLLAEMTPQIATHLQKVRIIIKKAWALVFARVAADVLGGVVLVAIRMSRRPMQILQASLVSAAHYIYLPSYWHVGPAASDDALLLRLVLGALVVHIVDFL
jgi:hypothetical protein